MSVQQDNSETWPPVPDGTPPPGADLPQGAAPRTPFLTVICVMWGVTLGQFALQVFWPGIIAIVCGLVGFGLAVFLLTRADRAAKINGGLRLGLWFLALLLRVLGSR